MTIQDLKSRLLAELKRDKKKTAIMGALLLVAAIAIGRLVLKRPSPPPAAAAPAAAISRTPAPAPAPLQANIDSTDTTDDGLNTAGNEYIGTIDRTVSRDIFAPSESHFPPGKGDGQSNRLYSQQELDPEHEAVWKEGREMNLESTILSSLSSSPKAIIQGQLVQVGDYVNGFRVLEIQPHSVVLEKEGVTVNLDMKHK